MYTSARLRLTLVCLAFASVGLYAGILLIARPVTDDTQKLLAAQTLLEAELTVQAERPHPDFGTLKVDALQASLLGAQLSPITTDAGSLPSKIAATNPNFAAAIVDMLRAAGVGPGDVVAVAYTGSFPALDIATVIAIETLEAQPVIVSSVGASNWGATDPAFTILDLESLLVDRGFIHHRSLAAGVGGSLRRVPMSQTGRDLALAAIERNGVALLDSSGLMTGVDDRMRVYLQQAGGRPLKAFVNVGGGQLSIGGSSFRDRFAPGLVLPTDSPSADDGNGNGLLARMRAAGVPTIHIDQIPELARQYQLPMSPAQTPAVGDGGPFRDATRVRMAAAVFAMVLIAALVVVRILALTPASEEQFDPYFGSAGFRLRRRASALLRRAYGVLTYGSANESHARSLSRRPRREPAPATGAVAGARRP